MPNVNDLSKTVRFYWDYNISSIVEFRTAYIFRAHDM